MSDPGDVRKLVKLNEQDLEPAEDLRAQWGIDAEVGLVASVCGEMTDYVDRRVRAWRNKQNRKRRQQRPRRKS